MLKPNKIVAAKGKRNVGAMTSGARGTNEKKYPFAIRHFYPYLGLLKENLNIFKSH